MPLQTTVWRQLGRPVSDLIGRRGISSGRDKPKRVVVTGLGMVTPLGADAKTSWSRLTQSHSGIVRTREKSTTVFPPGLRAAFLPMPLRTRRRLTCISSSPSRNFGVPRWQPRSPSQRRKKP
ncbi:hypothetical protein MTO96_010522 [Rhipicephalus appendiculatus]